MNSKKCHSVFQDEWFTNKKYKLWIAKTKHKTARCTLRQKEIDLSIRVSAALDSHAFSKKHTTKMIDRKQELVKIFIQKQQSISERVLVSESSATCQPSENKFSASNKIDIVFDEGNSTNAEILWTLKIIYESFFFSIMHGLR